MLAGIVEVGPDRVGAFTVGVRRAVGEPRLTRTEQHEQRPSPVLALWLAARALNIRQGSKEPMDLELEEVLEQEV